MRLIDKVKAREEAARQVRDEDFNREVKKKKNKRSTYEKALSID